MNKGMNMNMTKLDAINLLQKHSELQSPFWHLSPEGREYRARFDEAVEVLRKECFDKHEERSE